jgi:hypothetical protein
MQSTHWPVGAQTGLPVPSQFALSRHSTQNPFAVSQYGIGGAQSPLDEHAVTQRLVAGSQARFGSPQLAVVRHSTQWLLAASQYGLFPEQCVLATHSTQLKEFVSHAGASPSVQFASPRQATQTPAEVSQ